MTTRTQIMRPDTDWTITHVLHRGMKLPLRDPIMIFAGCGYLARLEDRGSSLMPEIRLEVIEGHERHASREAFR